MNIPQKRFLITMIGFIALACATGIAFDLISANLAVDYFSIHHPTIVRTENPWLLAFIWGVAASWWTGAIAGGVIAAINQRRKHPLPPKRVLRWAAGACVGIWAAMLSVMIAILIVSEVVIPVDKRGDTFEHDRRLMAVAMAHQYEYVYAGFATLILAFKTWKTKPRGQDDAPATQTVD